MALVSVVGSGTTAGTTLAKVWRKSQGSLLKGFNAKTEEFGWLKSAAIPKYKINESAREITAPIDIKRATHAASIPEGGYEANPYTVALNEVTFTWSNYNIRFSTTLTARYLDKLGKDNQIIRQFKYQSMKAVEGLADTVGRDFYGYSTGVWCETTTDATQASGTYTLDDLYGETDLGSAAFLGELFQVGDRVALVRSAALVTNAIGSVTAKSASSGTIDVTWLGSVNSEPADLVVLANSIENATIAGTNYNKALVGFFDGLKSASVHGLATSSEPLWATGYSDTASGRWSGVKLRKAQQGIQNNGGGKITDIIMDQGVSNDVFASQSGALRFANPETMALDGNFTAKGIQFHYSRKVPPGHVICYDRNNSVGKFNLLEIPDDEGSGDVMWEDGDKMEGQNAMAFSIDLPLAMVWKNRANTAYFSSQTTQ
jgi:hypothetical protein